MFSRFNKSISVCLTALCLLGAGLIGCQDNPVNAPAETAATVQAAALQDAEGGVQIPFADAEVFFEFNTTDNDLGLQIFLDAEGWETVRVFDPGSNRIINFNTDGGLTDLGITELRFESAEPSPEEVLALFPPGTYPFRGKTVNGDILVGEGELSHDFLPPPTFSPSGGEEVDAGNVVVTWDAPDAELIEVIIEGEDGVFDVIVSGETTSLTVSPEFLEPGTEYNIEVLAIGENGNKVITESTFVTMPEGA